MGKISILIPCFNAERWIAQSIRSALDQTYEDKEVIVVDDGSTDRSVDVIRTFGNAIRWEAGANRGGNAARNRLLELSTGDWLQYLDADDYLLPTKVSTQFEESAGSENPDVLWSPSIFEYWNLGTVDRRESQTLNDQDAWIALIRWRLPQTGAALWRKRAIQRVGGWKSDQPCCQEHELYFRLLQCDAIFHYCPSALSIYRQWSESTVCRLDPTETYRQRVLIIQSAGEHLESKGTLTQPRRQALAAAIIQCARGLYHNDPDLAVKLVDEMRGRIPEYRLTDESWSPQLYRAVYNTLGFKTAEYVAKVIRSTCRNSRASTAL